MNCVRCGSLLQAGQAQCSCGQYVDLPASEFYTRLENQVEKSSRDNFRRGLLIGLGFLFLFLLLETIMDTVFIAPGTLSGYRSYRSSSGDCLLPLAVGAKASAVSRRTPP